MQEETYRSNDDNYAYHENDVSHSEDYTMGQKTNRNNNYLTQSHDYVKKLFIHRNGDAYNGPRKMVWNKKQIRTMDRFLENLTEVLKPRNGMIREIHTPQTGTRITDFEDIEAYRTYVAVANGERLQKIDYLNLMQQNERKHRRNILNSGTNSEPVHPVVHSRIQVSGRIKHELQKRGKTVYIFRNGDEYSRPITVLLKPNFQNDMDLIFKAIEERVVLPFNKPLRRIYTMDGERITNPDMLEEKQYFVAAAAEPFIHKTYGQELPTVIVGRFDRHEKIKYLSMLPTPMNGKSRFEELKSHRQNGGRTFRNNPGRIQEEENEGSPKTTRREHQKNIFRRYTFRLKKRGIVVPSRIRRTYANADSRLSRQPQESESATHSRFSKNQPNDFTANEAGKNRSTRNQDKENRATTQMKRSHVDREANPNRSQRRNSNDENKASKLIESNYHWKGETNAEGDSYPRNERNNFNNEDFDQDDGGVFKSKEAERREKLEHVDEDRNTQVDLPQEMKRPETVSLEDIPDYEDCVPLRKNRWTMTDTPIMIEKSLQPEFSLITGAIVPDNLLEPINEVNIFSDDNCPACTDNQNGNS